MKGANVSGMDASNAIFDKNTKLDDLKGLDSAQLSKSNKKQ